MSSATLNASRSDAPEAIRVEQLGELLVSVNRVTHRLQRTHDTLRAEVGRLQDELKEANAQLRRSRSLAALGEMAAGIAHEVRNPLGSILLYVEMLAQDLADRPDQAKVCGRIRHAVERLDSIVNDVLSFARDTRINPAATNVGELVREAAAYCEALIEEAGVTIDLDGGLDQLQIVADSSLLMQAIANLVRNAVEAMAEKEDTETKTPRDGETKCWSEPRSANAVPAAMPETERPAAAGELRDREKERMIRISGRSGRSRLADGSRAERVIIAVEDSGPGVPPEVVHRMFNPFFTTRKTGTGLGLAIVHRIVDVHGGEVSVENRSPHGARIELRLPPRPPTTEINSREQHSTADIEGRG